MRPAQASPTRDETAPLGEGRRFGTSALTRVELPRVGSRARCRRSRVLGDWIQTFAELFDATNIIALTVAIIAAAAFPPPPLSRSLEAIHLASAQPRSSAAGRAVACGSDQRLQRAAIQHGLFDQPNGIRAACMAGGRPAARAHFWCDDRHLSGRDAWTRSGDSFARGVRASPMDSAIIFPVRWASSRRGRRCAASRRLPISS